MQTKQLSRSVAEGTGEVRGELEGSRNVLQDCKTSCWWWCSPEETRRRGDCECAMWKIAIKLWKCTLNYAPDMGSECKGGRGGQGNQLSRDWLAKVFSEKFCVRSLLCPGADDSRRSCTVASKEGGALDGNLSRKEGEFNWQFRLKCVSIIFGN